jgi:hypothetical protein
MEFIMKKKSFFLIGMTSIMALVPLAFAMIGCDTGTNTVTKTVTVPGTSTPGAGQTLHTSVIAADADAVKAFLNGGFVDSVDRLYIESLIELDGSYALGSGKTIVVTNNPPPSYNTLTLPNAGALFAITGGSGTAELKVNGTLKLEDGSKVVLGSENVSESATKSGKLTIAGGGKVLVAPEANIAVTTASRIVLAAENSVLTFDAPDAGNVKPVGTLDPSDKKFGKASENALVIIPDSGKAATNATAKNIGGEEYSGLGSVHTTAKSTASAAEIANLFSGSVTTVTYTGEDTLTSLLNLGSGKTLIIDGELTVGASGKLTAAAGAAINIPEGATLKVANGGEVDL